jgi:hypothetical protein
LIYAPSSGERGSGKATMGTNKKLGIGSFLAVLGGIGFILAPTLGATQLERPWSFIAGFVVGIVGGTGVALSIFGLLEKKR